MTQAHASGKVILFGEHAVVYGQPAIAVPVSQVGVTVTIETIPGGSRVISNLIGRNALLSSIPPSDPFMALIAVFFQATGTDPRHGVQFEIDSTIPVASGLGSGAAVSIALLRALNAHYSTNLGPVAINELAYEIEKIHHGSPSGIDNSVIAFDKPVFFVKGHPIETLNPVLPLDLLIGDTGIYAPTSQSVGDVKLLFHNHPELYQPIIDQVGEIAREARACIENGLPESLGKLMIENHQLLRRLTVSCGELDRLVEAAIQNGAIGAKLSGGGRGGNMIALVTPENAGAVRQALLAAGAKAVYGTTVMPL